MSRKNKKEMSIKQNDAPMWKRWLAFILDWYLSGVVSMAPVALMWNLKSGETKVNLDIVGLGHSGIWAAVLAILILIAYFYVIPLFLWPGQTPGKRLLSIAIVQTDGSAVDAKRLALRQIVILLFLETISLMTGNPFGSLVTLIANGTVAKILSYASMVLLVLSVLMASFTPFHQALHDRFAKTRVIWIKRENAVF